MQNSMKNPVYSKEKDTEKNEADELLDPLTELEHLSIYSSDSEDDFNKQVWLPNENHHMSKNIFSLIKSLENLQQYRMLTSLDDIKSLLFWKAVAAEFIGTLFLVLVGCGSCIQGWPNSNHITLLVDNSTVQLTHNYSTVDTVQIGLAFGLSVATVVWIIGHVSGGHVNPAVTCAMLITRRVSLARAFLFIVVQLFGAIAGAGILKGLTPDELEGTLGCTLLGQGVNSKMGLGVELCITYILVLTVFAACDKRRNDLGGSVPLAIGLSVTMCHLFAVKFTGSSMNTARSFGPAVVMGIWKEHWVFWVGPILGGMLAGLTYDNVFAVNASLAKCRGLFLSSSYDTDRYPAKMTKIRVIEEGGEQTVDGMKHLALPTEKDQSIV